LPILVRPVREQLEHDRVIRHLQAKLKRKFDVITNIGEEKNTGVRSGTLTLYPDLVLTSGRKISSVIEVETTESVNHLEALAQWAHFGRSRVPFHLYVPAGCVEMARRLAEENQALPDEIWSYHAIGDQIRFTMVHRSPVAAPPKAERAVEPPPRKATAAAPSTAKKKRVAARPAARPARASARRTPARGAAKKSASRAQKRK
jgi:hypothetical protein